MADIIAMNNDTSIQECKAVLDSCPVCWPWLHTPERGPFQCRKPGHMEMRAIVAAANAPCTCSAATKAVLGGACCSVSTAKPINPYDAVLARIDAELEKLNAKGR